MTLIAPPRTAGTSFPVGRFWATGGSAIGTAIRYWLRERQRSVPRPLDIALRFGQLADSWHDDVEGESNPARIIACQAYLNVIGLGPAAVPLILQDLQARGGFWFPALLALTGEWPVVDEDRGIPSKMKQAWLAWGRERGYVG